MSNSCIFYKTFILLFFSFFIFACSKETPIATQSTISFETGDRTVIEGASFTYTLRLTNTSSTDVTFDWSVQHISTSTSDFTGNLAGAKSITAGNITTDIVIDTSDDTISESTENFTLNITNITGASPSNLSARGSIENKPLLSLKPASHTATEGDALTYSLQLNRASVADVTFAWSVEHNTTIAGDFTGATSSGLETIAAGDTIATISIYTNDDTISEPTESFSLNITNITGASPSNLSARGSIENKPLLSLKPASYTATEGDALTYSLQLNRASVADVTFAWSVEHNTTIASDFTGAISGLKTIAAGDTIATISIYTSDDTISESTESFSLSITSITGASPSNLSARGSILDNDSIATVVDSNGNGLIDLVTQEQLGNIRYNLAGTSYKTSASDAGAACEGGVCRGYELLANIALSTNWQPIGSTSDSFRSRLQGNGYSITNLDINGEDYLGLFAALAGATIDNLIVEVASIAGDSYVGALAGSAKNSHFTNVEIRAASTSSKLSATGIHIGGMLGEIIDTTITNATSDLSIVVAGSNVGEIMLNGVGGIVGSVFSSSISYAYSSSSVFASDGISVVGGLVGWLNANSDLSYSSASGSVNSRGTRNYAYGGLVGLVQNNSRISNSSTSGSVTSSGNSNANYGGLVGWVASSDISHSSASSSVTSNGNNVQYGGLVGGMSDTKISYSSASGSVSSSGVSSDYYGGLVGLIFDATISYSSASGSVTSSGANSDRYGGLVGDMSDTKISYSSASGSVSSSGVSSDNYGGLVGSILFSAISYSSASGSVTSSGANSDKYGGLVGNIIYDATISYSSASGSVTSSGANSDDYGGLVGVSYGDIRHSWSSSSVFASNPAGLVGNNGGNLEFSYALGVAPYGLSATNTATASITNSYWNSETSGALVVAGTGGTVTNIASSDTASMLAATGSATSRIFKGFEAATAELGNNIWTFASGNYPVVTELGVDKQAVALAYGLLRLANPNVGGSTLDSFLGSTLNHEAIALDAINYNANEPLAILDVNLLASDNGCSTENNGNSLVSNSANSTKVKLTVNLAKTSNNLQERVVYTGSNCSIDFNSATSISAGDRLQLAATITKGSASLTKNFVINFQ